ncbi:MAG: cysteine desulfurase family protein [Candidatus Doudnabacteria bacterium]
MKSIDKTYLDNAASTQLNPKVMQSMKPFLSSIYGNPSSQHDFGITAKIALEKSREVVSKVLEVNPKEIIFTSGGTESTNLAIFGVCNRYVQNNSKPGHIITTPIEHEAVLEPIKTLEKQGWSISYLNINKQGEITDLDQVSQLIQKNTVLISVMYANNETGTILPINEIGGILNGINRQRKNSGLNKIIFHSDACQAGNTLELRPSKLNVDLLTLNGSKINGPKGSGILFKSATCKITPLIFGGGQEFGLRSGTENLPSIVGFATALKLAQDHKVQTILNQCKLQEYLEQELQKLNHKIIINGPCNSNINSTAHNFNLKKLPGTINFSVPTIESEALMHYLDAKGFIVSTGSACTSQSIDPSHVLLAMGCNPKTAKSSIRVSLNSSITKQNLKNFIKALDKSIAQIKQTTQEI